MKRIIKTVINLLFLVGVFPLYLFFKIFNSSKMFTTISEFLSLFPGYIGYFLRNSFYMLSLDSGYNFDVGFGSILQYPSIRIGNNVYIGQNCNIGKCNIGSDVKIGSSVHIVNKITHDIGEDGEVLPTDVKSLRRVSIGRKSWIGNGCIILNDIGDKCVIGAGSVVVKPIPDGCVAVGNPAKVIRKK